MSSCTLEALLGPKVVKSDGGEEVSTASVLANKKAVLLYFSAHWCPPCKMFTPILSKAYSEYAEKHTSAGTPQETEVLFCSWDNSADSFRKYHQKEMSFPALPFSRELGQTLGKKYKVEGIPSLVAINLNDGSVLFEDIDLRKLVNEHGSAVFPLTAENISGLKAAGELKKKTKLEELQNGMVSCMVKREKKEGTDDEKKEGTDGDAEEEIALADLFQDYEYVCLVLGDGDIEDKSYAKMLEVMKQVNDATKNAKRFALVYLGGSLYNEDSDHSMVASKGFPFLNLEPSDELKSCMADIAEGEMSLTLLLHLGNGLCNVDGKCEKDGVLYLVGKSRDTTRGMLEAGPKAFPWDRAAMTAFEEAKKKRAIEFSESLANFDFLKAENDDVGKQLLFRGDKPVNIREVLASMGDGKDGDAVVGFYFSAHWCPPCKMFTPKLVKAFGELKEAGKQFEIIFVSSDSSKEDFEGYYNEMKTASGNQFLALNYDERDLKNDLSNALDISGIPTLVFFKPDGTIITKDGREAIDLGALDSFPFDDKSLERAKKAAKERQEKEREAALAKERDDSEKAKGEGNVVLERAVGPPGSIAIDYSEKTMEFSAFFSTAIAPELLNKSGVLYYELEVLEVGQCAQFGFALEGGTEDMDEDEDGTGDNDKSWGFDGIRGTKFHDGSVDWPCEWGVGTVIGLAANMETGMIAASKDGEWSDAVFRNESIKHGVYPSVSADMSNKVRFAFSAFKHSPPPDSFWKSG